MIVICAWCQARQGEKEPLENTMVTHGICPNCFKNMTKEFNFTPPAYEEIRFKKLRNISIL